MAYITVSEILSANLAFRFGKPEQYGAAQVNGVGVGVDPESVSVYVALEWVGEHTCNGYVVAKNRLTLYGHPRIFQFVQSLARFWASNSFAPVVDWASCDEGSRREVKDFFSRWQSSFPCLSELIRLLKLE